MQALSTTSGPVELVALADVFADKIQSAYRRLKSTHARQLDLPPERRFVGLDGYRHLLQTNVDVVLLATPPGFRPLHFEAAVAANKHVFLEQPVAVDAPGVRRVLAAANEARLRGLAVVSGLQRRHEAAYQETIAQVHRGQIGQPLTLRVYWNGNGAPAKPRLPRQTELEYQLRNWYFFTWLSGDHIVEQHANNLDVGNWLMGEVPLEANAQGGREIRRRSGEHGGDFGQIFDHFFCEFVYRSGTRMFSQCRQIPDCWNVVGEHVQGGSGRADISGGKIYSAGGELIWQTRASRAGQQQTQQDLLAALRSGCIPNEGDYAALATLTAIMGRQAAYSGKCVTWDEVFASDASWASPDLLMSLEDRAPTQPDARGDYPLARPGQSPPV
jgi:predicted dehydrogenase